MKLRVVLNDLFAVIGILFFSYTAVLSGTQDDWRMVAISLFGILCSAVAGAMNHKRMKKMRGY